MLKVFLLSAFRLLPSALVLRRVGEYEGSEAYNSLKFKVCENWGRLFKRKSRTKIINIT